jgi:IS5 family transposase
LALARAATTLLAMRDLLETNAQTHQIFDTINGHVAEKGLMVCEGSIVGTTLIAAPPSIKNKDGERDAGCTSQSRAMHGTLA